MLQSTDTERIKPSSHTEFSIRSISENHIEAATKEIIQRCEKFGHEIQGYDENTIPGFKGASAFIIENLNGKTSEEHEKIIKGYLDGKDPDGKDSPIEKFILRIAIKQVPSRISDQSSTSGTVELQSHLTHDNTKDTPPVAGPSHQPDNIRERNTLHNIRAYDISAILSIAATRLNQKKSLSHKDTYESIRESCIKIKMFRNFYDSNQSLVSRYANTYGEVTEAQAINATSQLEVSLKKLKLAKESAMYIASSNIYGPLTE